MTSTVTSDPTVDGPSLDRILAERDDAALRRRLREVHSTLRDHGHNPIDALQIISSQLQSAYSTGAARDDPRAAHVLGAAFQEFISDSSRGVFGQYMTPAVVARHVAALVLGPHSVGSVLDPFMGSAILLDAAGNRSPSVRLVGVEINEAVAAVGRAALLLGGHANHVSVEDAFSAWLDDRIPSADYVVMNPPYGAQATLVDDDRLLSTRTAQWLPGRRTVPVELIAMELAIDALKPGGLLGAVMPLSLLNNNGWRTFRREFFGRYRLRHVTVLPEATFGPFNGVARACVVVVEKAAPVDGASFGYWESTSVGYDETGRPAVASDLETMPLEVPQATWDDGEIVRSRSAGMGGRRLGDIAEIFRGKNPARDAYTASGAFLLKVGSLSGRFISWRDRVRTRVPPEFAVRNQRIALREGDICFTGSAHRPSYIGLKVDLIDDLPEEGALPSGEVVVIRLDPEAGISPVALLYYLRSADGYKQIQHLVRGSTAHVYPSDLVGMRIPDLNAQLPVDRLERLHLEAQSAHWRYLRAEDEVAALLGDIRDPA